MNIVLFTEKINETNLMKMKTNIKTLHIIVGNREIKR